jgi:hypothetical protein
MAQAFPETEQSEAAAEGEQAHELAARMIMASRFHNEEPEVTEGEMYEAARLYADDVIATAAKYKMAVVDIEKQVEIKRVHAECFGTPDAVIYDRTAKILFVWDFKYGHREVEVFENKQLITYVAGLFDRFDIDGLLDQETTVVMKIVQPRSFSRGGSIREWRVKGDDLRGHINLLGNAAQTALGPNPHTKSGEHCRYCPGRHACEAALQAGVGLYEVASTPVPMDLTPAELGLQLAIIKRAKEQLEFLETGYEEQVKSLGGVPGWSLESSPGREGWSKPVEEVFSLGDIFGHDLRKPPEAITPNQARKLGIPAEVVAGYAERKQGGLKVVRDDGSKARAIFGKRD